MFRPIADDDMRWVWAAYRKGGLASIAPDGLTQQDLKQWMADHVSRTSETLALFARMPGDREGVVGLAPVYANGVRAEPHFLWFPWASTRNRLESAVNLLDHLRRTHTALLWTHPSDRDFWVRLCQYGVLNKGCRIPALFDESRDAMLYYTRRPKHERR